MLIRPIKIYLYQNGAFVFAGPADTKPDGALIVGSVDTIEEAKSLQVMLCKLSRVDNETYYLPFTGEYEAVEAVMEMLEATYQGQKQGLGDAPVWKSFVEYQKKYGLDTESLIKKLGG